MRHVSLNADPVDDARRASRISGKIEPDGVEPRRDPRGWASASELKEASPGSERVQSMKIMPPREV